MRVGRTLHLSKSIKIPGGILLSVFLVCCAFSPETGFEEGNDPAGQEGPRPAVYDFEKVLEAIDGRTVGIVTNQTGSLNGVHLVDTLINSGIEIIRVFAPEHGFRGEASDGASIADGRDPKTGLEIISLYGTRKKPSKENLENIQLLVFDIQDVGARFYTYLSTLHYIMQACSELELPLVLLDRPNPNIHYVDGPVLKPAFSSFVGLHPVPVVYGMTIGEYAKMINGEGWHGQRACDLTVLPCLNYGRNDRYRLPNRPSPNLPTMESVYLYPSLCFFEGTNVSVGRGTESPFTVIGEPGNRAGDYTFTPKSIPGASLHPKHEGDVCRGYDLSEFISAPEALKQLDLSWLIRMYRETPNPESFFKENGYFDKLAGTDELRKAIVAGTPEGEIRSAWRKELNDFETIRRKYLIYP
jgi:uncharacterized protein YbbC (DUF1343 family)